MTQAPFVSYAQNHEDVVLARALKPDDRSGFWIDVGAGHPLLDSVTAAFAERGWRGINVEPLAREFELLCSARPDDINLHMALGSAAGHTTLFEGPPENRGASTIMPEVAARYEAQGQVFETTDVQVATLAEVVERHAPGPVDFLKVDVEGAESQVLRGADWSRFRPRVVVVEATQPNSTELSHTSWEPMLIDAGYCLALFDGLNRFYTGPEHIEVLQLLSIPANVFDGYAPYRFSSQIAKLVRYSESLEEERARFALGAEDAQRVADDLLGEIERLSRELLDARSAIGYALVSAEAAREAEAVALEDLAAIQLQAARALGRAQRLHDELAALQATRTFRYTAPLRDLYARARSLGGL